MTLTLAFSIARGGMSAAGHATSILSRNVAGADDPNAARKSFAPTAGSYVGIGTGTIVGAVDHALFEVATQSSSGFSELDVVQSALDRLGRFSDAPATVIGDLRAALQTAVSTPLDAVAARAAIAAAATAARTLNDAASEVSNVRQEAHEDIGAGLNKLKALLGRIGEVNSLVVRGTTLGQDFTDAVDQRNALVREVAELVEVRLTPRAGNDLVLHLADGTTLFETSAREITFSGPPPAAGQPGSQIRIDGVGFGAGDGLGGKIGGLLKVRDEIAVTYGRQIDEVARGLIVATAESDQSPVPVAPALAGLFTYAGGPSMPPSGVVADGLAAQIGVNPNVDPAQGGSIWRLRDGGISDPGNPLYVYNGTMAAGFSDRLLELSDRLSAAQPFDAAAGLTTSASVGLLGFAADSAGWLEGARAANNTSRAQASVLGQHAREAWQNRIGVNLDDEMAKLIALERSHQASSRLIATVDNMFDALFRATV